MKTVYSKSFAAILAIIFVLFSCQKDKEISLEYPSESSPTSAFQEPNPDGVIVDRAGCSQTITIPANSVDALSDALSQICTGGTIWLASGQHTENQGIIIGKRVNIKGQEGAVLRLTASPTVDYTLPLNAGLHFKYSVNSRLENIALKTTNAIGGIAVLLDKSGGTTIKKCHFSNFQYGILVEKSPNTKILDNIVAASKAWQTGAIPDAYGITIINGPGGTIKGNEVSGALFGVWPCDYGGIYEDNYTHDNLVGLILCKVPTNSMIMPNGDVTGAKFSSTHWTVTNNVSSYNQTVGYLVIDGANQNKLINNDASNNGTYDMELTGDSYRFGFLTPLSHHNFVQAGTFQYITIKDCGVDNTVYGGVQVDVGVDACY